MLDVLLAHLVGDYLLQSHWQAVEKTRRWWPAIVHAVTYTLPYLLVTRSPAALAVIASTHAVIDRYRIARHVVWCKNLLAPRGANPPWRECTATGYPPDTPAWLSVWLMIVADNTLHLLINAAAVAWLGYYGWPNPALKGGTCGQEFWSGDPGGGHPPGPTEA